MNKPLNTFNSSRLLYRHITITICPATPTSSNKISPDELVAYMLACQLSSQIAYFNSSKVFVYAFM